MLTNSNFIFFYNSFCEILDSYNSVEDASSLRYSVMLVGKY